MLVLHLRTLQPENQEYWRVSAINDEIFYSLKLELVVDSRSPAVAEFINTPSTSIIVESKKNPIDSETTKRNVRPRTK